MSKKKAIMGFKGIALAPVTENTVLSYASGQSFAVPYAGSMSRTPKERTGEVYYDDELYAQFNDVLGEEAEIRIGEVSLELLANLGLGTFDAGTNKLEANFSVTKSTYALRCIADTADEVPFYFNWRAFDLTSIRFDNFATKNNSVTVCEVIIKGIFKKPLLPTLKPWALMQLKDDGTNRAACEAFMANGESYPVSISPIITITSQPEHAGVTVGDVEGQLAVTASVTQGAALTYQWYSNTTLSNVGGALVSGASNAVFPIPTGITAGTHYYYCVVSAPGAQSVPSNPVVVIAVA